MPHHAPQYPTEYSQHLNGLSKTSTGKVAYVDIRLDTLKNDHKYNDNPYFTHFHLIKL